MTESDLWKEWVSHEYRFGRMPADLPQILLFTNPQGRKAQLVKDMPYSTFDDSQNDLTRALFLISDRAEADFKKLIGHNEHGPFNMQNGVNAPLGISILKFLTMIVFIHSYSIALGKGIQIGDWTQAWGTDEEIMEIGHRPVSEMKHRQTIKQMLAPGNTLYSSSAHVLALPGEKIRLGLSVVTLGKVNPNKDVDEFMQFVQGQAETTASGADVESLLKYEMVQAGTMLPVRLWRRDASYQELFEYIDLEKPARREALLPNLAEWPISRVIPYGHSIHTSQQKIDGLRTKIFNPTMIFNPA